MKISVVIVLLVMVIAGAVYAQLPEVGYIGLYTDHPWQFDPSMSCVTGVGFYPVEMWIYCLPSNLGMMCAQFMISYPPNIIQSTVTTNPAVAVTQGTLDTGMSVCFQDCQWDWQWPFHQSLYVTDQTPTWIEIVKHPDPNVICVGFATCAYAACGPA
ncbi:MAG: hypothetical protein JSV33_00200 [bacterium]|nr:MAG: hypothetical protein JSV33_00200 [bacterium]